MATIHVPELDERTTARLRARATRHGRSLEAEARAVLESAAAHEPDPDDDRGFVVAFVDAVQALGGVDLDIPPLSEQILPADRSE